jgi:uncharacterized protein (TIGR02466 family)
MSEVIGLFPTPLMRSERILDQASVAAFSDRIKGLQKTKNAKSKLLCHTEIVDPDSDVIFSRLGNVLHNNVAEFGKVLFGEELRWSMKEMWFNVMETGGFQSIHSHANSFISGVLYLTKPHPTSRIVFTKSLGGTEFVFNNFNKNAKVGAFNGIKWFLPEISPGDLILFPSYLLHEVPLNQGGQRISIAFNAIPERLDSSGYAIRFSK